MKASHRSLLLGALALCAAAGAGCSPPTRTVVAEEVLNLYPFITKGYNAHEEAKTKLMVESKSDYVVVLGKRHRRIPLAGLDLPGACRIELGLRVLGGPPASRHPLQARVTAVDASGAEHVRVATPRMLLEEGQTWVPVAIDLDLADRVRELELGFTRADLDWKTDEPVLAVLRPRAVFEREWELDRSHEPRQVLLITTDTLRADHLGCYGNATVRTPRLDELAADSVRFRDAYSVTNVTNPSHTSIFTSLYLKDHKVTDNFTKLSPDVPTLIDELSEAGYRTGGFVSSFNFQPEKCDFDHRFDDFFACAVYFERRAEDVNADLFPWLGEHRNDDFFAWVHYFDAHMPYEPPWPYNRMYPTRGGEKIEIPSEYKGNMKWFSSSNKLSYYTGMYMGEVSYLDARIGDLTDRLRALEMYDDATIVLVSDHGESLGEHGIYCEHYGLHEATTRVPLLVKLPGARHTGERTGLVSTLDVYPTLFDFLDLPVDPGLRGRSLRPWIESGEPVPGDRAWSEHARIEQVAVRTPTHRFLEGKVDLQLFPDYGLVDGGLELYDLVRDPGETRNLADEDAALAARLRAELDAFLEDARDHASGGRVDEAFDEGLEAIGYTE